MSNTAGVPVLNSFAQAKERYERTKPIRGHKDKIRPLGNNRRYYNMASFDMPDADTVVFSYYNRPFVTWKSDDSFTVHGDVYQSPWVAEHLKFFLPKRWTTGWDKVRMTIGNNGKRYLLGQKDVFQFVKAGDDYEIVNPPKATVIRKRRNVDNRILEKAKPFLDWLTVVTSVSGVATREDGNHAMSVLGDEVGVKGNEYYRQLLKDTPANSDLHGQIYNEYRYCDDIPVSGRNTYMRSRRFHTASCAKLLEWVTAEMTDRWVLAMHLIAARQGYRRWSQNETFELTAEQAEQYLLEVIRHVYRDEIFYTEQLDDGEIPSKRNSHYWNEVQFTL
jgi:hypothetical protein